MPIHADELAPWLALSADELARRSPLPLRIFRTREELYAHIAGEMLAEARAARERGEELTVIVPIGPKGQYPLLAAMVNHAQLPLDHVSWFGMDEWLDWESRPLPLDHPFSLAGWFQREFLERIRPDLRPRPENVVFPAPAELDRPGEELARRGGAATTYAGFGFQGHIAFNEPPGSRWTPIGLEQLRRSQTRIVPLAVDTIIAHAQRSLGGNVAAVPPMAVTLGMRELLGARRLRLATDGGAWKQTILRILLFAEPTPDYPVTLVREHPDVEVWVDAASAAAPSTQW